MKGMSIEELVIELQYDVESIQQERGFSTGKHSARLSSIDHAISLYQDDIRKPMLTGVTGKDIEKNAKMLMSVLAVYLIECST